MAAADDIEAESLKALDWPAVCAQVAAFASTPMATEIILGRGLPIGSSQRESETLLEQTAQAQAAQLRFDGAFDLRPLVNAVVRGRMINPLQLNGVASTLQAVQRLSGAVGSHEALRTLLAPMSTEVEELLTDINHCINSEDSRILDRASQRLAEVRRQRQANSLELRATMNEWARKLHASGVSERAQVVLRRDRQCVAVRAGRQGELPRGSVTLATSGSGATLYMEPEPAVLLNNTEARLSAAQEEEERAILIRLSQGVAYQAEEIGLLLEGVAALDVVAARAAHAAWLAATRPAFIDEAAAAEHGPVCVPAMQHPLLLQPCLEQLPSLAVPEDADFESNFMEPVTALQQATGSAPEVPGRDSSNGSGEPEQRRPAKRPCPVDLTVPPQAAVVMVTGPNTGGKTASLKALGLSALMAKAGLFLPLASADVDSAPRLLWFDKVLADVGDGQTLQQSLSTFSAHVRRLRLILATTSPGSLALLDEVGSGTDPAEGEALAAALLQELSHRARLTFATTHHAGLKDMSDARFVNASVEFDIATLRPTYRLLWGLAGQSNALAIAEGLGFSRPVIQEARKVANEMRILIDAQARSRQMSENLAEQTEEAQAQAARAEAERQKAEQGLEATRQQLAKLQQQLQAAAQQPLPKKDGAAAQQQLHRLIEDVRSGRLPAADALRQIRQIEVANTAATSGAGNGRGGDGQPAFQPSVGQKVLVRKMGGSVGTVVQAGSRPGTKVTVKVGQLQFKMHPADLSPVDGVTASTAAASRSNGSGVKSAERQREQKQHRRQQQQQQQAQRSAASQDDATVQTAANTVDVRGQQAVEACLEVEDAIAEAPIGMAVAIVHGTGTGRLRTAIHAMLKNHPQVKRFELDPASNGGCTLAYLA